jgi:thiosulfate reductase cytochrome b subunit
MSEEEAVVPAVGTEPQPAEEFRIEKRHPLAIRWFHWLNFPILFTMIWSGILIYWADTQPGQERAGQFYRIGWGDHTIVRLFPEWFYRPEIHGLAVVPAKSDSSALYTLDARLAEGMGWHFFFMWLFAINGLAYVLFTIFSGQWRYLVPNRHSLSEAWQVVLHDLHIRKEPLPKRKYNGAQQIAYTMIVVMGLGSLITGLAVYKPTQLSWPVWLGGYTVARFIHFWLTMGYVAFFLVHIIQVFRAGWNNFRGMVTGRELVRGSASAEAEVQS